MLCTLLAHTCGPQTTPENYLNEHQPVLCSFNKNLVWLLIHTFPIRVQFSICCSRRELSVECQGVGKTKQFCCFAAGTHQGKLTPSKTHSPPAFLSQRKWPLVSPCEIPCKKVKGRKRSLTPRKNKWFECGSYNTLFLSPFPPISIPFSSSLFQQDIWNWNIWN